MKGFLERINRAAASGMDDDRYMTKGALTPKSLPHRPGIPILIPLAVAFWASSAIAYGLHIHLIDLLQPWALALIAVFAGIVLTAALLRKPAIAMCSMFSVLGLLIGCVGCAQMDSYSRSVGSIEDSNCFVLEQDSKKSEFGSSCIAKVGDSGFAGEKVLLYLDTSDQLYRGQVIEGRCSLSAFAEEVAGQYWLQGVSRKGSLKDYRIVEAPFPMGLLIGFRKSAIELFGKYCGDEAGILQALVCGFRNTIEDDGAYEQFKICGIAHIVAVSGAHLAIVAALLMSLLSLLKIRRPIAVAAEIAFLLIYLVFAGIPISAVRAVFMVVLSLTSFLARRRSASLNSLAVCIIAFILISPSVSVSLSFFLSAGSVLGISLFSPLFASVFSIGNERFDFLVSDPLALTVSSNVITLPASAALFSQLSLISPIANIVAAPLFSLGCIAGLICVLLGMLLPVAAPILLKVASICVLPLRMSVAAMSGIPYACIALDVPLIAMLALTCAMVVVLWVFWSKIGFRALRFAIPVAMIALMVVVLIPIDKGDRICMLDVGQGDSFLIESEGATLLIDTGNKDSQLREAIAKHGIKHIDAVMITHPDSDHCDSLSSLSGYVDIGSILVASDLLDCGCEHCTGLVDIASNIIGCAPKGLSAGDRIEVGKFTLDVVWPHAFTDEGGNGDSICVVLSCDADRDGDADMKAFFCGDAETDELKAIMDEGKLKDVDILKVGHHGSKVALDRELVDAMSPQLALIGVGANNRYGHPSEEVLDLLRDEDTIVYRSDLSGSVDVSIFADGMRVACEKMVEGFDTDSLIAYQQ